MSISKVGGLYLGIYWADEVVSGYYDAYALDRPTTRYYYDGQMPIEEDFTRKVAGVDTADLTRHGLGARGVDFVRVQRKVGTDLDSLRTGRPRDSRPTVHGGSMSRKRGAPRL